MIVGTILAIVAVAVVGVTISQQRKMAKQQEKAAQEAAAVQISGHDSNRGLYVVYGRQLVGSTVVWKGVTNRQVYEPTPAGFTKLSIASTGSQNGTRGKRNLYRAVSLAEGPVEAIEDVIIDGHGYNDRRFNVRTNRHWMCHVHPGNGTNNHYAPWVTAGDSVTQQWDTSKHASEVAMGYENLYLQGKSPAYQGEPTSQYIIKGRKVYDPRKDTTVSGGSGTHRDNNSATWEWSDNPALCVLDYITNTRYGMGIPYSDINKASFMTMADKCDVLVTIPSVLTNTTGVTQNYYNPWTGQIFNIVNGAIIPVYREQQSGTTQKRYTMNIALDPTNSVLENLNSMLDSFKGNLMFANGEYRLHMDDVESTVASLTDDDLVGSIKISKGDRNQRINRCTINFTNSNKKFKRDSVSWPTIDSAQYSTYLSQDNNEPLHQELTINGITDYYQAEDMAEFLVRDSRSTLTVQLEVMPRFATLLPGEVISLTSDAGNWTNKWFRIVDVKIDVNQFRVFLTLREYVSSVYTWNAAKGNEPLGYSFEWANSNDDLPSITGLTLTGAIHTEGDGSTSNYVTASWDEIVDAGEVSSLEILWATQGTSEWNSVMVVDPDTQTTTKFQVPFGGITYDIRVRYRTFGDAGNGMILMESPETTSSVTMPALDSTVLATANLIRWLGDWSNAVAYVVDDVVRYTDGRVYICILDHTNQAPSGDGTDTIYWELFVDKGQDAALQQAYRQVTLYKKDDPTLTDNTQGTFDNPLSGMEAGWGYSVPTLTADGEQVYAITRRFTSDGLSPQDATWSAPVVYASRQDGVTGTPGQGVRYPSIFRKNNSTISSASGTYANPLDGNAGWSYSVPAITADGDEIFVSTRIFTSDGASPQEANWSTPALYATRVDGSVGQTGSDGRPGVPGASTLLNYNDLQGTANVGAAGQYKISNSLVATNNGLETWAALTDVAQVVALHIHTTDTDTVNNNDFYDQIMVGDIIVWYKSNDQWIEYEVDGVPSVSGSVWTIPIAYREHDDANGANTTVSVSADPITFRFSRVYKVDGQSQSYPVIYRKNSSAISSGSGSFATPLDGNPSWSFDVPAITADGDEIYVSSRIFTSDGASPQEANWSTPSLYAKRVDGNVGQTGANGRPGLPGTSKRYIYDDLQSAIPTGNGDYAFRDSGGGYETTWSNIKANTAYVELRKWNTGGTDRSDYLDSIIQGDVIVWYDSIDKWVDFLVTGQYTMVGDGNTFRFPVQVIEWDESGGTANPSTSAGVNIEFLFSRATDGAQGVQGTPGDPGLPSLPYSYKWDHLEVALPGAQAEYAFYNGSSYESTWSGILNNTTTIYMRQAGSVSGVNHSWWMREMVTDDLVCYKLADDKWIIFRLTGDASWSGNVITLPATAVLYNDSGSTLPSLLDGIQVDFLFQTNKPPLPSLPTLPTQLKYYNMNLTTAGNQGTYVLSTTTSIANGTDDFPTWLLGPGETGRIQSIWLNDLDQNGVSQAAFLSSLEAGDTLLWWRTNTRWQAYTITSILSTGNPKGFQVNGCDYFNAVGGLGNYPGTSGTGYTVHWRCNKAYLQTAAAFKLPTLAWTSYGTTIGNYSPATTSQSVTVEVVDAAGNTITSRTISGTVTASTGNIDITTGGTVNDIQVTSIPGDNTTTPDINLKHLSSGLTATLYAKTIKVDTGGVGK